MPLYDKAKILAYLKQMEIPYQIKEHPPLFTMEEMEACGLTSRGDVCKNLFLRDNKGRRHFLVVLRGDKHADLKQVASLLGTSRLGFASSQRLLQYLGVTPGSVSPLGILNDNSHSVTLVLDEDIAQLPLVGVHPNDNTATLWLTYTNLMQVVAASGNSIKTIKL